MRCDLSARLPICLVAIFALHCTGPAATDTAPAAPQSVAAPASSAPKSPPIPELTSPGCEAQIFVIVPLNSPKLLAQYNRSLPEILLNTKVRPVIYLRPPAPARRKSAEAARETLAGDRRPRIAVGKFLKEHRENKAFLRETLLSEGYLFETRPELAAAKVREITLPSLYDESVIYRWRHNRVETLRRQGEVYVDEAGDDASLYLNDRTAVTPEALAVPLHLDIEYLRETEHALRVKPVAVSADRAVVEWIFPSGEKRPALIALAENKTHLVCIGGDPASALSQKKSAAIFWNRHKRIVQAVHRTVAERPIFDEPKDEGEDVQEDGELRVAWKQAYYDKKTKFKFREVEYDIFDRKGNPVPPQVCVDFILDTWERASGTWYAPKGDTPQRREGEIDFNALGPFGRRYIASILGFAAQEGSPFDRYDIPRRRWVPLQKQRLFAKNLVRFADHFREGDVLVIHGLRDEDEQEHFHTVLILSTDPITGVPTEVADNQGRPRISSLKTAMRAAPRRSIKHRLRLDYDRMVWMVEQARALAAAEGADTDTGQAQRSR